MKNFLSSIQLKIRQFMQGRCGPDELTRALYIAALALMLLGAITRLGLFSSLALVAMIWAIYRMLSRNYAARDAERAKWREIKSFFRDELSLLKSRWRDRKTHKYFRCPACKKALRVPRGKGTVKVTCPRCGNRITKKT